MMNRMPAVLAAALGALFLAGCAKAPKTAVAPLTEEQARKAAAVRYRHDGGIVETHKLANGKMLPFAVWHGTETPNGTAYPSQKLHIIHRTHSSKVVALKTIMMFGGLGYQESSKHDLKGDTVEGVVYENGQAAYLPLKDYLAKKHNHSDTQYDYFPLAVVNKNFYLVYEKFNKDERNEYRLVQNLEYDKPYEYRVGSSRLKFSAKCRQDSLVKPLAQWEADNYRAVHEGLKQYAHDCAKQILQNTEELDDAYRTKEPGL